MPIRVFADANNIWSLKNRGLKSPRLFNFPSFRRFLLIAQRSSLTIRHAEFSSASVRGEGRKKARGEILKFAVKREQGQACLNFAEREQIEQC